MAANRDGRLTLADNLAAYHSETTIATTKSTHEQLISEEELDDFLARYLCPKYTTGKLPRNLLHLGSRSGLRRARYVVHKPGSVFVHMMTELSKKLGLKNGLNWYQMDLSSLKSFKDRSVDLVF